MVVERVIVLAGVACTHDDWYVDGGDEDKGGAL